MKTAQTDPPRLSVSQAAALQLAPGVASVAAFAFLAWMLSASSLPNVVALGLTIVFIEIPISWGLIYRYVSRENEGVFSLKAAFPWMAKIPLWQYALVGVPFVIYSIVTIIGLGAVIGEPLREAWFSWLPEWFVLNPDPAAIVALSTGMKIFVSALMFFGMVVAGGLTQELFSRGFLLPRIEHLGFAAPLYNALLFTAFHLVSPWSWLPFFVMILPWSYLVWWKRSVKIGIFVHVGMLLLQWLMMSLMMFGMIPLPPAG